MADDGNKLLQENVRLLNDLTKAYDKLDKQQKGNLKNQNDFLQTQKILNNQLKSATGAKEYARVQKEIEGNIKATALAEKESIKIAVEKEKLSQQKIRTEKLLTNQTNKLTSEYKKQSATLTQLRNKAKDLGLTYGTNSKEFKKAQKEVVALDKKLKKLDSSLGQNQRNVGNYTQGLKGLAGALGVTVGIQAFVNVIKDVINVNKVYEKSNAELASVLGKTRKETIKLQKESMRLGSSTAFSATQVTELQIELARLGKTESEIVDMTEGIINATIALNSETGETAKLVGATLNAFNKDAKDSALIADQLTLATQRSAVSFEYLNTALPIASGAANAAGVSFEDLLAQLGKAADRGIDASTAATSLRNIYIELAAKGIKYEDALDQINNSTDKLTVATELFGKRAAVTALALAENREEADLLSDALENAGGTAQRVAEEQLNTLDGKLKLLNSAWEGLVLNIGNGETALGKFSKGVVDFATNAVNGIANVDLHFTRLLNYSDDQISRFLSFATVEESGEKLSDVLVKLQGEYNNLSNQAKARLTLNQFLSDSIVRMGEDQEEVNHIVDYYVRTLKTEEKQVIKTEQAKSNLNKQIEVEKVKRSELNRSIRENQKLRQQSIKLDSAKNISSPLTPDRLDKVSTSDNDPYMDKLKARIEATKEYTSIATELAGDLTKELVANSAQRYDDEIQANRELLNQKLNDETLTEERKQLIQAEAAQKEKELKKKKAKAEKNDAIFKIGIDTAVAVGKAIAASPLTFGLPFSAYALAQGAANSALVAAKPIPQFDKGTKSLPSLSEVAEKRPELILKDGKPYLFDQPTILGKEWQGSEVISGAETANLMSGLANGKFNDIVNERKDNDRQLMLGYALVGAVKQGTKDTVKAINNKNGLSRVREMSFNNKVSKFSE